MPWNLPPDRSGMGGVFGAQDLPLWMQSGMQEAPPNGPAQRLLNPFNPPRRVGIGESVANALIPRRDEQGMPQAPGVGDFINAAMWALPGMRGPGAAMAAEKGGAGLPRLGGALDAVRRNRMTPEERRAGFDRMAKEIEGAGGNPPQPRTARSSAFDRLAEEMRLAEEAEKPPASPPASPPSSGGKPSPGDTYNAVANMAATGDASSLVAHANKFNIPNEQVQAAILQAYDNHKPTATSAYNRFLSARGELK